MLVEARPVSEQPWSSISRRIVGCGESDEELSTSPLALDAGPEDRESSLLGDRLSHTALSFVASPPHDLLSHTYVICLGGHA